MTDQLDDLDTYRERVRTYMEEHLPKRDHDNPWHAMEDDDNRASMNRELQRRLFDGGFAGVCYPKEYGGQSLPIQYQRVIDDVSEDFDMPLLFSTPTMSITGPTVLAAHGDLVETMTRFHLGSCQVRSQRTSLQRRSGRC